jgi:FlaA1/EpsC-like NDP-sugar epimerase
MIRLFRVSIPATVLLLVVSDTILIAACYIAAAYLGFSIYSDPWTYFVYENGWVQLILVVLIIQVGMYFLDMYDDLRLRSRSLLIQQLCVLVGVSFLIQALVGYSESTLLQLPQWTMVYGSGLVLLVLPAWRKIFFSMVRKALPDEKILLVGLSPESRELRELMESIQSRPDLGYTVIGCLQQEAAPEGNCLGTYSQLTEVVMQHRPSRGRVFIPLSQGVPHTAASSGNNLAILRRL